MLHTTQQSKDFFAALRKASVEILTYYKIPTSPKFKTRPWKFGRPKGVTEHYTAGVAWKGSANWLNSPENKDSSCHLLVLDRRVGEIDSIVSQYPVLDALPVTCLMLADLDKGTWHATWSNEMNVGIENRNAGCLKLVDGKWRWWAKNWTAEFPVQGLGKLPTNIDGQWWEPYTHGQVVANIIICQHLHCLYQDAGGLDQSWFIPHSCVQEGKMDTGRAFPLQNVREAVFSQMPWENLSWLQSYKADPQYMDDYEEEVDADFLRELSGRQGNRDGDFTDVEWQRCISLPEPSLQALVQDGNWKEELDSIRRALSKLSYVVGGSGPVLDEKTSLALYQFQRCVGLETSRIPDTKTQEALYARLKGFQLHQ